jgi:formate hydrogenlyase subunit 3/multisubunit Na+/H+ antiporter MnhD subunit
MPLATPLLPVILLLLGAVILPVTSLAGRAAASRAVAIFVSASAFLSCVLLFWSRPGEWTAVLWRPEGLFVMEASYYADALAAVFAGTLTLVTLVAVLVGDFRRPQSPGYGVTLGGLLLLVGAACLVILAGDLLALCLGWGLLDIAFLVLTGLVHRGQWATRAAIRLLSLNYLAGVALLAALLELHARGEVLSWHAAPLPILAISLMMLAALVRLGLYPAFLGRAPAPGMRSEARTLWHVVPVAVGGYLLVRAASLAAVTTLPGREVAIVLGSVAVALSPFGLWFETGVKRTVPYIVLNQVGHMALATAIVSPYSPAILASQALSLALSVGTLLVNEATQSDSSSRVAEAWRRSCVSIAVASVVATPLTLGFVGRQLLYESLIGSNLAPVILVSLMANSFMVAPLLKISLQARESTIGPARARALSLGGLTAVASPLLVLGLEPPWLGRLLGAQGALAPWPTLEQLLYSPEGGTVALLSVGTIASLGLGYVIYRYGQLIVSKAGVSLETLHAVAQMEWLFRGASWAAQGVASVLQHVGEFFEGRNSLGWILVFATLVTLLLLSS